MRLFFCGYWPNCLKNCPRSAIPKSPSWCFFSTKPICSSTTPLRRCWDKIEQVVRLIRSKGVGVYFVTQSPSDVPADVLGQLGNRVQHALRAFTPKDRKAVKTAAETFRPNPAFETDAAITELAVGEALVSTLEDKGVPSIVERARIVPPRSRMGPISAEERTETMNFSPIGTRYDETQDRVSAFETLQQRAEASTAEDDAARFEATLEAPPRP